MQRIWCGCLVLLCFGSGLGGSISLAKPPDLPVDLKVECADDKSATQESPPSVSLEFDVFSGKISLSVTLPWSTLLGAGEPTRTSRANPTCDRCEADSTDPKLVQARALYEIAERCRRQGDLDKARTCYEETHLLAPTSRLGRQAMQRLSEIENRSLGGSRLGDVEESEPRPSRAVPEDARQSSFLDMLRDTIPLGLVPVSLPR